MHALHQKTLVIQGSWGLAESAHHYELTSQNLGQKANITFKPTH